MRRTWRGYGACSCLLRQSWISQLFPHSQLLVPILRNFLLVCCLCLAFTMWRLPGKHSPVGDVCKGYDNPRWHLALRHISCNEHSCSGFGLVLWPGAWLIWRPLLIGIGRPIFRGIWDLKVLCGSCCQEQNQQPKPSSQPHAVNISLQLSPPSPEPRPASCACLPPPGSWLLTAGSSKLLLLTCAEAAPLPRTGADAGIAFQKAPSALVATTTALRRLRKRSTTVILSARCETLLHRTTQV